MAKITTAAWVLLAKEKNETGRAVLKKDTITFDDITENEVLVAPIYGCWEANMTHALERKPVDVCLKRGESKVVLGNAGVVRVLKVGSKVNRIKVDDFCVFIPNGTSNRLGYLDHAFGFGFDETGSIGMLAKQTKVFENQLITLKKDSRLSLRQWPLISVRFGSGWSNWKVARKCWDAQVSREEFPSPYVFGWGGGVALSELLLAKEEGFNVAMMAWGDTRLEFIRKLGILPIDRRLFPDLYYDHEKYENDRDYRKAYFTSLNSFRKIVDDITHGDGVSIFIENIGQPVYPASLRVLGRPGVIATTGWKKGMNLEVNRALECHFRHIHVFTHALRLSEGEECVAYAEDHDWIPLDDSPIYDWENIPQLAEDFSNGKIDSYFPIFQVNPV